MRKRNELNMSSVASYSSDDSYYKYCVNEIKKSSAISRDQKISAYIKMILNRNELPNKR